MAGLQLTAANSTPYLIPLIPQNQEFDISLNGTTYHLRIKWNSFSNAWILYIEDSQRNLLLSGIPMVTGCDLLEQYAYIGIDGAMVVQSSTDPDEVPDYTALGSTGNLFFLIPIAPAAVV
jgi:hypothetical protein